MRNYSDSKLDPVCVLSVLFFFILQQEPSKAALLSLPVLPLRLPLYTLSVQCWIVEAAAFHCADCLSYLCSLKEEGRGHGGSEQPQGRPSVRENKAKSGKGGVVI